MGEKAERSLVPWPASGAWFALSKHVLAVEDDKDILELITYNLEREGYEVTGVMSGEDGVDAARSEKPDLVLLDLMLPGMDGLEVYRKLKADPDTSHLPVIMVTAKGEEADIGLFIGIDKHHAINCIFYNHFLHLCRIKKVGSLALLTDIR